VPKLAVVGFPVAHSRSPAMQNAALEALGLAGEWSYGAIEAAPEDFERVVRELARSGEYAGLNVTVPHKEAALALADEASAAARAIGAANTLSFHDGRVHADNTDAGGLRDSLPGSPRGRRTLVLGAGGAARAAIWMLAREGAAVSVWNRTGARAAALCLALGGAPVEEFRQGSFGIIVNTTTVGLFGEEPFKALRLEEASFGEYAPDEPPLRAEELGEQVVVDMVYAERPSRLLEVAKEHGATTVDGLEVLVRQGARSLRIWTGQEPPVAVMRAAARG
jgi:shikimate dehydrogenase